MRLIILVRDLIILTNSICRLLYSTVMEVKGFLIKFHIDFISTAVIGLLWRHLIIRGAKLMGHVRSFIASSVK